MHHCLAFFGCESRVSHRTFTCCLCYSSGWTYGKMCSVEEVRCSAEYNGYCLNGGVCCHTEFAVDPFCMSVSLSLYSRFSSNNSVLLLLRNCFYAFAAHPICRLRHYVFYLSVCACVPTCPGAGCLRPAFVPISSSYLPFVF